MTTDYISIPPKYASEAGYESVSLKNKKPSRRRMDVRFWNKKVQDMLQTKKYKNYVILGKWDDFRILKSGNLSHTRTFWIKKV